MVPLVLWCGDAEPDALDALIAGPGLGLPRPGDHLGNRPNRHQDRDGGPGREANEPPPPPLRRGMGSHRTGQCIPGQPGN